jgi:hypothetical protein
MLKILGVFMQNLLAEEERSRMPCIKEMIRKMDAETYKNTVNAGADVAVRCTCNVCR